MDGATDRVVDEDQTGSPALTEGEQAGAERDTDVSCDREDLRYSRRSTRSISTLAHQLERNSARMTARS